MGIWRKLPEGLAAGRPGSGEFAEWGECGAWGRPAPPGAAAASRRLVAARNSLRPMAEFLGSFFMRLLDKRSNGVSTNISAALYVTVALKQASKIVFLMDSIGHPRVEESATLRTWWPSLPASVEVAEGARPVHLQGEQPGAQLRKPFRVFCSGV